MRNEVKIDELIITSDNSGAIGQKEHDVVQVPDEMTSYFSARVNFLEQLANFSKPTDIILLNFSSDAAWQRYISGIQKFFEEVNLEFPRISGSTETNIPTLQSGVGMTMIGKQFRNEKTVENLHWYSYGMPLVGEQLLAAPEQVANVKKIVQAFKNGLIEQVIPVGSKGVLHELENLGVMPQNSFPYDETVSAGPSTVVLLGVEQNQMVEVEQFFENYLHSIK